MSSWIEEETKIKSTKGPDTTFEHTMHKGPDTTFEHNMHKGPDTSLKILSRRDLIHHWTYTEGTWDIIENIIQKGHVLYDRRKFNHCWKLCQKGPELNQYSRMKNITEGTWNIKIQPTEGTWTTPFWINNHMQSRNKSLHFYISWKSHRYKNDNVEHHLIRRHKKTSWTSWEYKYSNRSIALKILIF